MHIECDDERENDGSHSGENIGHNVYLSAEHDDIDFRGGDDKSAQERSQKQTDCRAHEREYDILAEDIAVNFLVVKAQYFQRCDFSDTFGNIYIRQVIQYDESQRARRAYIIMIMT